MLFNMKQFGLCLQHVQQYKVQSGLGVQYAQQVEEQSCLIWVYRMLDCMRISLVWVYSKWISLDLVYSMLCNIKVQHCVHE